MGQLIMNTKNLSAAIAAILLVGCAGSPKDRPGLKYVQEMPIHSPYGCATPPHATKEKLPPELRRPKSISFCDEVSYTLKML